MARQRLDGVSAAVDWLRGAGVESLVADSRRLQAGKCDDRSDGADAGQGFVAWPGAATDGRRHVAAALAGGAVACLVEAQGADDIGLPDDARIAAVDGLRALAGPIAAGVAGDPSARLAVVAVTGTNGKTSTAWWTAQALGALGRRAGVVGTLGAGMPPLADRPVALVSTGLTTPDPVALQSIFRGMVDDGCSACAIEASSIGIAEQRLAGTHIAVAVLTNLTQDHLDYHGTMAAYGEVKRRLFDWPGLAAAVVNVDDGYGAAMAEALSGAPAGAPAEALTETLTERLAARSSSATRPALWTYAVDRPARLMARDIVHGRHGLHFTLHEGTAAVAVRTAVIGEFNVGNLLAVAGALRALGVPLANVAVALAAVTPAPGRMQRVPAPGDGPDVVVDYAHTPDALDKALTALRPHAAARGGRLVCVFGCGGDRDASKRPLMGAIAERLADRVVVTSDNPRGEDPAAIVRQILAGMRDGGGILDQSAAAAAAPTVAKATAVVDRRAAISLAVGEAAAADVVLIAGKGHESTQMIAGAKLPFDDAAVAAEALAVRRTLSGDGTCGDGISDAPTSAARTPAARASAADGVRA